MEVQKKLALITDAGSGIGFELARVFAKNDFDLIIASDSDVVLDRAKLLRQYEVEVSTCVADLSTQEGCDELYAKIGRPLDVAVFNSSLGNPGEFIRTDFAQDLKLMNLGVVQLVGLSKKILQDMVIRDEGRILFTSSLAAEVPGSYSATFAATQAFLQTFVQAIRFEVTESKKKIKITYLEPRPTDSEFFSTIAQQGFDALMSDKALVVGESLDQNLRKAATKILAQNRTGEPARKAAK